MQRVGSSEGGLFKREKKERRQEKNIDKLGCGLLNSAHFDFAKLENNSEIKIRHVQVSLLLSC